MTTFATYTRTSRKHRTGRPQISVLALRDGKIVGRMSYMTETPSLTQVLEFCSQFHPAKPVVDRCDPILL